MEKEDPIEKLERKQAEQQSNGGLKAVMIAMIVVALGLGAALFYVLSSKNKLVGELNEEKADLTEQMSRLTIDDLRAFHTKYIKGRPLVVVISGNAKRFDPKAVANLLGPDVKPIKVDFDQMFRF